MRTEREAVARAQRCHMYEEREGFEQCRFGAILAIILLSALVGASFMVGVHFSHWLPLAIALGLWTFLLPRLWRTIDRSTVGL